MKQPDLSTSIVIMFIIVCLIFVAGLSYKWIVGAAAVVIPGLALTVFLAERGAVPFLTGYQVNRILAFVNPGKYADLNVQQDNSKMAIGSGMLYGKGLLNETAISVKNGNFLSEEHTDFIFAVIGEEMGFVGCMLVLVLYLLFVFGMPANGRENERPDWKASLYGNSCSRWIPGIYKHCGCHRNFPEHRASASVYQLWCKFSGKSLYRHRRSLKRRTAAK